MIAKIIKYLWKTDGMEYSSLPANTKGEFRLLYDKMLIGILSYEYGNWLFKYSDEFKNSKALKPIMDFPDVDKVYKHTELWPFFATRIPSLNQPFHFKKIKQANANKDDSVALLKLFGNETITNPFKLSPV